MPVGDFLDGLRWEDSLNVDSNIPWAWVLDIIRWRKPAEHTSPQCSLLPVCRCNLMGCPKLLPAELPYHDGLDPGTVGQNGPFLPVVPFLRVPHHSNEEVIQACMKLSKTCNFRNHQKKKKWIRSSFHLNLNLSMSSEDYRHLAGC